MFNSSIFTHKKRKKIDLCSLEFFFLLESRDSLPGRPRESSKYMQLLINLRRRRWGSGESSSTLKPHPDSAKTHSALTFCPHIILYQTCPVLLLLSHLGSPWPLTKQIFTYFVVYCNSNLYNQQICFFFSWQDKRENIWLWLKKHMLVWCCCPLIYGFFFFLTNCVSWLILALLIVHGNSCKWLCWFYYLSNHNLYMHQWHFMSSKGCIKLQIHTYNNN